LAITLKTETNAGDCDIAASTAFEFEFAVAANIATNAGTANTAVAYQLESSVDTDKTASATGYTIKKQVTSASFVADNINAGVKPSKFTIGGTTSAVGALAKDGIVTVTAGPDVFVSGGADLAITITKPTSASGCTATAATSSAKILAITLKTETNAGDCDIAASTAFEFEFAVAANIATNGGTAGAVAFQLESSVDTDKTASAAGYTLKEFAADPTFSPASGNVAADSALTLTSAGNANICMRSGSTAPTCSADGTCGSGSTAYNATAKPTVTATVTWKAIGCAGTGKIDSAVVTAAYTVNTTTTTTAAPATTTISGASAGAVWSAMVTVLALMGVSAML